MAKWILFEEAAGSMSGKTRRWNVVTKDGRSVLGFVFWIGAFRCYGFAPEPCTEYEATCLRDIADFCAARTTEHRDALKTKREVPHAG